MENTAGKRGPRPRLDLEHIVAMAIDIADTHGLGALTMKRLAEALGVGTMSLYRYVPSKQQLIALMLDTAIGTPAEPAGAGWRAALEHWAHESLAGFLRHPWTLSLVTTSRVMGPHETAHLEAALRGLSGTGLTPTAMLDTVLLVNGYVRGMAQYSVRATQQPGEHLPHPMSITTAEMSARYPMLTAIANTVSAKQASPDEPDREFEFGLQRILDGIEIYLHPGHTP